MAVKLMVVGGMLGTIIATILFIPLGLLIQLSADVTKPYIFWILLAIVIFVAAHGLIARSETTQNIGVPGFDVPGVVFVTSTRARFSSKPGLIELPNHAPWH